MLPAVLTVLAVGYRSVAEAEPVCRETAEAAFVTVLNPALPRSLTFAGEKL